MPGSSASTSPWLTIRSVPRLTPRGSRLPPPMSPPPSQATASSATASSSVHHRLPVMVRDPTFETSGDQRSRRLQQAARLREVAGDRMALSTVDQGRLLLGADRLRLPAAGAEAAAGRRVDRARHVALEHDPLPLPLQLGV